MLRRTRYGYFAPFPESLQLPSPCQEMSPGAPVKRASTRVKVPPVQLDGSAPKTVPTASPRGGVGSRHGVEPAGRNEHMNHINEPRKLTPGSRAPQALVKAEELEPGPTVVGSDNGPAGSARRPAAAGGSMRSGKRETCHGGLKRRPQLAAQLQQRRAAARARTGVGGVSSSDDPVPDLWSGEPAGGATRDATCSAGEEEQGRMW